MKDRTTRQVILKDVSAQMRAVERMPDRTRVVRRATANEGESNSTLGHLVPGSLLLNRFAVRATIHPHETSYPGVFRCLSPSGEEVMVKVAPTQHPPKVDLWHLLPELRHPNVVRTLQTSQENELFYEVQEYYRGGSLAQLIGSPDVTSAWIIGHLVPQVNEGLKYLHGKNIVHRDVKPSNLYLNGDDIRSPIVLGDFDISSLLLKERTSRHTSRMAGTWAYTAPEGFPRFIGDKDNMAAARVNRIGDYYSLGITIIELMTGTTSLHSCGLPDLYDFYLAGGRVELPDAPPRLQMLLKGLLVRNRQERWGGDQVDRWLRGANTREDIQSVINDQRFSFAKATRPFELGGMSAVDLPSLALAMENSLEEAKSHLLESELLTLWIVNQDATVAHHVERTREIYRHWPDLAVLRCIMHCDPTRPLAMPGYGEISDPREWGLLLARKATTEKHLETGPVTDFELRRFEQWLELKTNPQPDLAAKIAEIRQRPIGVRFEEIAYLLDRKLPYSGQVSAFLNLRREPEARVGGQTPKEIVAEAFGKAEEWEVGIPTCFRLARDRWVRGCLEAWLRQRGMGQLAVKAATAAGLLKTNYYDAFDTFLRHVDPWAEKPQVVFDEESIKNGPRLEFGVESYHTFTYRTIGVGMPLGSVKLEGAPGHAVLNTYQILGRTGKITLSCHPHASLSETTNVLAFRLVADKGNYWMEDDGISLRYPVFFPTAQVILRMIVYSLIGALTLGGARAIASIGLPSPITFAGIMAEARGQVPFEAFPYILGAMVCLAGIYGGYRMWLMAYVRSGR